MKRTELVHVAVAETSVIVRSGLVAVLKRMPDLIIQPVEITSLEGLQNGPGHIGEAGWTWYTGSSGWYFRVFTEELLGLKPWHGMIYIRPCLPDGFSDCRVTLKTRSGRTHDILIGLGGVWLDGEIYDGKGIPYI